MSCERVNAGGGRRDAATSQAEPGTLNALEFQTGWE